MTSGSFVLRGGSVVDGTSRPAFAADVLVDGGSLTVAPPGSVRDHRVVDVDGLVVAPGFIDVHAHTDLQAILWGDDPAIQTSRLRQGVTTEVTGNCGFSPFPIPHHRVELGGPFVRTVMGPGAPTFPDAPSHAAAVSAARPATNVAPLVGHGALRVAAVGYEDRRATTAELAGMQAALEAAMTAGAFGLSTGLVYTPATFAPPEEVAAVVGVLARTGGVYATHIRNGTDLVEEAIEEALGAVRPWGVPLQISHIKVAGRRNWGTSGRIIERLERARSEGVDVKADIYPYTAASTSLFQTLPPWMSEGGIDVLVRRLRDPAARARADHDLRHGVGGWQNLGSAAGWDRVTVAFAPGRPDWVGATIAALSEPADQTPVDTIARVLLANDVEVKVVLEVMDEADIARFLAWEHTMIGSDGLPLPGKPHPRATGTFPRVLGRYRDVVGGLEATVHRMTGLPARRFGIPDRGVVATGSVADLVVFDPDGINDCGTYDDPWAPPVGVCHVLMAGTPAVWDGEVVDPRAGKVLRRDT